MNPHASEFVPRGYSNNISNDMTQFPAVNPPVYPTMTIDSSANDALNAYTNIASVDPNVIWMSGGKSLRLDLIVQPEDVETLLDTEERELLVKKTTQFLRGEIDPTDEISYLQKCMKHEIARKLFIARLLNEHLTRSYSNSSENLETQNENENNTDHEKEREQDGEQNENEQKPEQQQQKSEREQEDQSIYIVMRLVNLFLGRGNEECHQLIALQVLNHTAVALNSWRTACPIRWLRLLSAFLKQIICRRHSPRAFYSDIYKATVVSFLQVGRLLLHQCLCAEELGLSTSDCSDGRQSCRCATAGEACNNAPDDNSNANTDANADATAGSLQCLFEFFSLLKQHHLAMLLSDAEYFTRADAQSSGPVLHKLVDQFSSVPPFGWMLHVSVLDAMSSLVVDCRNMLVFLRLPIPPGFLDAAPQQQQQQQQQEGEQKDCLPLASVFAASCSIQNEPIFSARQSGDGADNAPAASDVTTMITDNSITAKSTVVQFATTSAMQKVRSEMLAICLESQVKLNELQQNVATAAAAEAERIETEQKQQQQQQQQMHQAQRGNTHASPPHANQHSAAPPISYAAAALSPSQPAFPRFQQPPSASHNAYRNAAGQFAGGPPHYLTHHQHPANSPVFSRPTQSGPGFPPNNVTNVGPPHTHAGHYVSFAQQEEMMLAAAIHQHQQHQQQHQHEQMRGGDAADVFGNDDENLMTYQSASLNHHGDSHSELNEFGDEDDDDDELENAQMNPTMEDDFEKFLRESGQA